MRSDFTEIDRKMEEFKERLSHHDNVMDEFHGRLDFSWIYHDNALEGVVLSYHELKAAIDTNIISDVTLIPSYVDINNHKVAIQFIRDVLNRRKSTFGLDFMKKLFQILSTNEPLPRNCKQTRPAFQYRKDNPLHRMYFHEISPPDKISYRVRKLVEWLGSEETKKLHPIKRAAKAHFRLISIFPWPRHSGKVSRLLMNAILIREGYLPAIVHAIERQRYYEVLRTPHSGLTTLVIESIAGTIEAAHRFLDELEGKTVLAAS